MQLRKKVKQRDDILLDYDKHKTEVIKLNANPAKDPAKLATAEKKFEEYKELYTKTNTELLEELTNIHNSKYKNFIPEYKLLISSQLELFASASEAFKSLVSTEDHKVAPAPRRPTDLTINSEVAYKVQSSESAGPKKGDDQTNNVSSLPSLPKKDDQNNNVSALPPLPKKDSGPPQRPPPIPKKD